MEEHEAEHELGRQLSLAGGLFKAWTDLRKERDAARAEYHRLVQERNKARAELAVVDLQLADAREALGKKESDAARAELAALKEDRRVARGLPVATWCPCCGYGVAVDEDGCCGACGADATGEGADDALRARTSASGFRVIALHELEDQLAELRERLCRTQETRDDAIQANWRLKKERDAALEAAGRARKEAAELREERDAALDQLRGVRCAMGEIRTLAEDHLPEDEEGPVDIDGGRP